jgi:hypothetical protein
MEAWMCSFDWGKVISAGKDLVLAGAAIVTARAAVQGISKWRAEEQGKADFELAKRSLGAIFRFQTSFQRARSAFTSVSEFPDGYNAQDAGAATKGAAWAHVFEARIAKVFAILTELDGITQEMDALWGNGARSQVDRLFGCYSTLRASMQLYVQNEYQSGRIFERNPGQRELVESHVFDMPKLVEGTTDKFQPNELTERLVSAVKASSAELRVRLPMHKK